MRPAPTRRPAPAEPPIGVRRRAADRSRRLRWVAVLISAAAAAAVVGATVSRAEQARARWADDAPVLVASRPVPAGEELLGAVEVARWPADLVPEDALQDPTELIAGATAPIDIGAGSPITSGGTDAPDGTRRGSIAIPPPPGGAIPDLQAGDRVEVWATWDPSLAGEGPPTRRVVAVGRVTTVRDGVVTVSVPAEEIGEAVEAVALATVTVVGSG